MSRSIPAFVDTHLHLWDLARFPYPWLDDPDFAFLREDYGPGEWRGDVGALELVAAVHVQAEVDHAVDPVEETAWLRSLDFGEDAPALVYVAYADLRAPDLDDVLARHRAAGPVRGIRQEAWFDPQSTRADIPRTNLLDDAAWQRGLRRLPHHDLSFDLLAWPHQLDQAASIFSAIPELTVVLEHTGLPPLGDAAGMDRWRAGLRRFARDVPGALLKISAMAFISGGWTVADVAPIVHEAIETFGPDRCMLGSNFPVDRAAATYEEIWTGYAAMTSELSRSERDGLFRANAFRAYRIASVIS